MAVLALLSALQTQLSLELLLAVKYGVFDNISQAPRWVRAYKTAFLWKFLSEAFGRDYRASTPVICSINPFSTQIANRPTFSRNFRDMGYRLVSR